MAGQLLYAFGWLSQLGLETPEEVATRAPWEGASGLLSQREGAPDSLSTTSASPDTAIYDPQRDTNYDIPNEAQDALKQYGDMIAIGGYLSPEAYDPQSDTDYDVPEGLPELKALYAAAHQTALEASRGSSILRSQKNKKKKPRWAATGKQGLIEVVDEPTVAPFTSIGRVFVDNEKEGAILGSTFRPEFGDDGADALVGPDGLLSSAHLFHPLKDIEAAHVRFMTPDGNGHNDYTVKSVAMPQSYVEARDRRARYDCDYAVLQVAPLRETEEVSKVVPALSTTLGRTFLTPKHQIVKVGFGRMDPESGSPVELLQDKGHFMIELGPGKSFGSEGWGRRGLSGGPSFEKGRVVGVNCAGGERDDIAVTSRVFKIELENMVEKNLDWAGF
ncbi:hypothetical protein KFL_004970020 [Klebsormidium nitens]|uniref:Uncharacterized protein n=1 Tax=Klebsormidium nitens TaxID=105231 RepID=A0A1Y1IE21_KLENI|nr:hypothetical protein KFL_004970020 [Klebsormidium nitens]|eukprot:GAQ89205.1 hypothetical protein KFL_004970020 [Klebsormidium nitens]